MSGIIAGAGSSQPNDMIWLDWSVASFSIASGSSASPYAIPNTKRTIQLDPTISAALPAGGTSVLQIGVNVARCKVTSANTDTYVLGVYFSTDGGTTFTEMTNGDLISMTSGNNGKTKGAASAEPLALDCNITATPTSNQIILQLMVVDATAPTTDAFSISNLRVSGLCVAMK